MIITRMINEKTTTERLRDDYEPNDVTEIQNYKKNN